MLILLRLYEPFSWPGEAAKWYHRHSIPPPRIRQLPTREVNFSLSLVVVELSGTQLVLSGRLAVRGSGDRWWGESGGP